MLLRTASSFSLLNADHVLPLINSSSSAIRCNSHAKSFVPCASRGSNNRPLTGVVFEPFEEVKKELDLVPTLPEASLARQKYTNESEAAINEQIKWVASPASVFSYFEIKILFSLIFTSDNPF